MTGSSHQIRHITAHDVAAYVRSTGWSCLGNYGREASVFSQNDYSLLVPLASDFADYETRMLEVVANLAKFERRSQDSILRDLAYASSDVLRIRLENPLFDDGEVTLNHGIVLFDNAQKIVHAAARSAVSPKPYHLARPGTQAEDFLKKAKLGQTEIGSYILTIVFPVTPDLLESEGSESALPFERKVTRSLATGLNSLESAVRSQVAKLSLAPFLESIAQGVSANLCEALSNIGEGTEGSIVDTQITWARNRSIPELVTKARFTGGDFSYLRSAATYLKEQTWDDNLVISGPVTRIESEKVLMGGEVFVYASVGDSPRRVKVTLNKDQYKLANEAHLAGHNIEIGGILQKSGRYLTIDNPTSFCILNSED